MASPMIGNGVWQFGADAASEPGEAVLVDKILPAGRDYLTCSIGAAGQDVDIETGPTSSGPWAAAETLSDATPSTNLYVASNFYVRPNATTAIDTDKFYIR